MTNYMGKRRLLSILIKMLSDCPELQKQIQKERDFMKYSYYRGSEWLKVWLDDCRMEIYADGARCKAVTFTIYRVNGYGDVVSELNRIVTKYSENFEPMPLATWFSGGCEQRKRGYYPFHKDIPSDVQPIPENLNPDMFVCYDIAKQAK
ncbi:MAG: hypothetical protein HDT43_00190 [Ruminococcaceae bacterium]|nr:hypothetical protein [Oscillospiraceae bacterium]